MFLTISNDRYTAGDDFRVSASGAQRQTAVRLASLGARGFVSVWADDTFSSSTARAQRFDLNGRKVGAEFVVSGSGGGIQPSVTATTDGGFVITWTVEAPYPSSFDLKGQRFDADGNRVGSEFMVNTRVDGFQTDPIVTAVAGGGFIIAWEQPEDATFDHVRAQVFAADGTKIGGEIIASDARLGDKNIGDVIALAGGGFVVAWSDAGAEADVYGNLSPGTRAQLFDAFGNKVGAAFSLNTIIPGYQQNPTLAALPSGGFVAAWSDDGETRSAYPNNGNKGIWIQIFDAGGNKIGAAVRAGNLGPLNQDAPTIAITAIGFLVSWTDGNSTADSVSRHLRAQAFDFAGNKVGEEFSLNPNLQAEQYFPDSIVLNTGAIVVGWSNLAAPQFNDEDVRARLLFPVAHGTEGEDNFVGTNNRDFFLGKGGNDQIAGGAEDDSLSGGAGNDVINGDDGDDLLDGDAGTDILVGSSGNDTYVVDSFGDTVTELSGEGIDTVRTAIGSKTDYTQLYVLPAFVENVAGTSAGPQGVWGNTLDNMVTMGDGNDLVVLADGGVDTVAAGGGNDFIYYGAALTAADKTDGGAGTDTIGLLGSYNLTFAATSLVGVERLALYTGLSAPGGTANNYTITTVDANIAADVQFFITAASLAASETFVFNGSAERNAGFTILAGAGNDIITGGVKDDYLSGGAGADQLYGRLGDDTLYGGLGADLLSGGSGRDWFRYQGAAESTGLGFDQLLAFDVSADRIDLPGAVSGLTGDVGTGRLAAASFDADLAAAADAYLEPNSAILFRPDAGTFAGRAFAIVDANGDGAYQAGQDYVIELVSPVVPLDTNPIMFV